MQGYEREEYENLDEYEDDADDQEEDEEGEGYKVEETYQPSQEELEYLGLRQRLKESIRKQLKKEMGIANTGSHDKMKTYRKDNYGSFFGPSQPVIAQRVIQESKSLLENPNLAARINKPNYTNNKGLVSSTNRSKPQTSLHPKVTSGLKKKVEMLRDTRDYSFLLSDDAAVPSSMKSPPSRNLPVPKSDGQSTQLLVKNKNAVGQCGRGVFNGREDRKQEFTPHRSRVGQETVSQVRNLSVGSRKQLGSNNGSGPGRPLGYKTEPFKSPVATSGKNLHAAKKSTVVNKSTPSPSEKSVVRRPTTLNTQSGLRKSSSLSVHPSYIKKQPVEKKEHQENSKLKVTPKQALPSSRNQHPVKISARGKLADGRPKAKVVRHSYGEDSDGDNAINMIRQMFRYNPKKYQDSDDDSDMEANFDDILREERHSEKIARREDEEELRLLEEEERRRQLRQAKKRKLNHH